VTAERVSDRGYALATAAACAIAIAHVCVWRATGPLDDDAILYRYGANLARGLGLVFNPGERVEGYTAPPLVFFHALVEFARVDHVLASRALGIASYVGLVLALSAAWRTALPKSTVPWPALLAATMPAIAFHANAGLGTLLTAALVAQWMLGELRRSVAESAPREARRAADIPPQTSRRGHRAADIAPRTSRRGHPAAADVALGFACLLRPEMSLLMLAVVARLGWKHEWKRAAVTCAPPLAWLAFRLAYYGAWVPNTYSAKNLPLLEDLARGWAYLIDQALAVPFLPLGVILVVVAWVHANSAPPLARELAVALLLAVLGVVAVGGDYMPLGRMLIPSAPIFLLAMTLQIVRRFEGVVSLPAVLFVAVMGAMQVGQFQRAEREASLDQLERRWQAIGVALRERAAPQTRVATQAIGFVGYESRLPILDMLGLVDPVIAHGAPHLEAEMKGHTKYDAEYVLSRRPDIVLLGDGLLDANGKVPVFASQRELVAHARFVEEYEQASIALPGTYLLVYWKRRGTRDL